MSQEIFIEKGAYVHPTAVIYPGVIIKEDAYIGPYCVIGAPPEHRAWLASGKPTLGVVIGPRCRLEKMVVVDAGTVECTNVFMDCMLMSGCHVGHDATLYPGVIVSPKACIGGHCQVYSEAYIGMGAILHQFTTVKRRCMIGAGAVLVPGKAEAMLDCETWAGVPAVKIGPNKKWLDS